MESAATRPKIKERPSFSHSVRSGVKRKSFAFWSHSDRPCRPLNPDGRGDPVGIFLRPRAARFRCECCRRHCDHTISGSERRNLINGSDAAAAHLAAIVAAFRNGRRSTCSASYLFVVHSTVLVVVAEKKIDHQIHKNDFNNLRVGLGTADTVAVPTDDHSVAMSLLSYLTV